MAYLLRKIRKNRWYKTEETPWLLNNELQADALDDLRTKANELSVYHIDDDESNLNRVVAALAANADNPSNIDFAIFNQGILREIGIKARSSRGELPDDQANEWHNDLYELSAPRLLELAKAIETEARIERKGYKQILTLVADSLVMGQIDRSRIKWGKSDLDRIDRIVAGRRTP